MPSDHKIKPIKTAKVNGAKPNQQNFQRKSTVLPNGAPYEESGGDNLKQIKGHF
jgi:hypothetical protein